jgi:hypothetical protein
MDRAVERQVLRAGDYCAAIAGTIHGSTYSQDGCTFILIASEPERLPETSDTVGSQAGLVAVLASEGAWRDGPTDGVAMKPIFSDPARRAYSSLVRMRPGARLSRHRTSPSDHRAGVHDRGRRPCRRPCAWTRGLLPNACWFSS